MDNTTKTIVVELSTQDYMVLYGFADIFNEAPAELAAKMLQYTLSNAYRVSKVLMSGDMLAREI